MVIRIKYGFLFKIFRSAKENKKAFSRQFAIFPSFRPGQHFVYNVAFTRIFGAGMDLRVGMQKVAADLFFHVRRKQVIGYVTSREVLKNQKAPRFSAVKEMIV